MPLCPRGHAGSRVVFGGFYGRATRRQMYKCYPAGPEAPHRFAPLLPRLTTAEGRCGECENKFHRHEGPQVVRGFEFPARTVAEALVLVASGVSYTRAADSVRLAPSRAGELVSDWVGAFTPALWARLGPKTVPTHLVVDSSRVTVSDWRTVTTKWPPPKFTRVPRKTAYTLVSIVGTDRGQSKPYAMLAVPADMDIATWTRVLAGLPGRPHEVTVDGDPLLMGGIRGAWPDDLLTGEAATHINYCLYHLQARFVSDAAPGWVRAPATPEQEQAARRLLDAAAVMARSTHDWLAFVGKARALNNVTVNKWLARDNRVRHVAAQLDRGPGTTHSNAAAEAELRWVKGQWAGRASCYRNEARTNLLLQLMTLHRRGDVNVKEWSRIIRATTGRAGGRPHGTLRGICDPVGAPSLRA